MVLLPIVPGQFYKQIGLAATLVEENVMDRIIAASMLFLNLI